MGIEPTALAWEARVLPLYDARLAGYCRQERGNWQIVRRARARISCMNAMPEFILNGQARRLGTEICVTRLLEDLGYAGKRVAVEMNGAIVPKSRYAETWIKPGNRIEIVVAVGGG